MLQLSRLLISPQIEFIQQIKSNAISNLSSLCAASSTDTFFEAHVKCVLNGKLAEDNEDKITVA